MRTLILASWSRPLILMAAVALAGCDDDVAEPTIEEVAGEYLGVQFTARSESGTVDLIENGAEVVIVLHADGTTTGHLFIPDGEPGGEDMERDLAGHWAIEGTRIDLDHDSFLAAMHFRWRGDGLIEGELEGGLTYELRLARLETGSP